MDNSLVTHLKGYFQAMFQDIAWLYRNPSDWKRDQSRLLHELDNHGSRIATLDLPAIAKHLDRCLDEGAFTPSTLSLMGLGAQGHPKFLGILWKRIFPDGKLGITPDLDAINALRQLLISCKKLRLTCSDRRVSDELKEFFKIERDIRRPTSTWDCDTLSRPDRAQHFAELREDDRELHGLFGERSPQGLSSPHQLAVLQHVCDRIATQFGDLDLEDSSELPKHGPGVVATFGKDTSKYTFVNWSNKLQESFPADRYASYNCMADPEMLLEGGSLLRNHEVPCRLIAVPKTQKAPRLIACEPNEHQWLQQLVRSQLEQRLARTALRHSISFRSQEPNRLRAMQGSIDGSFASVDLSSASDRLSCWTVERAFRRNLPLLRRLHACRTRWVKSELGLERRFIRLNKFGPMGSAVTFPVQSIVYACVGIAAVILSGDCIVTSRSIERASRQVTCFGDDILLPVQALPVLVALLTDLGLKVNTDKTFSKGNFRESCGIDCMLGVDLTPAYLLNPATRVPMAKAHSQIAIVNNFWQKGLWHTSNYLMRTIDDRGSSIPIVGPRSSVQGFISYCGTNRLPSGWHEDLQQETYRGVRVVTRVPIGESHWTHRMFQWFCEKPPADSDWSSGIRGKPVVTLRPGVLTRVEFLSQLTT